MPAIAEPASLDRTAGNAARRSLGSWEKNRHQWVEWALAAELGIDDEEAAMQTTFLQKSGFSFASLVEPKKEASNLYSVGGIPTTVVMDQRGTIKAYSQGTASYELLRETLQEMGMK